MVLSLFAFLFNVWCLALMYFCVPCTCLVLTGGRKQVSDLLKLKSQLDRCESLWVLQSNLGTPQ